MSWYLRWRNVFRSERLNRELEDEFQYHLAETVDRLVAGGMPEKEALRAARLRMGNYTIQKERTRDMNVAAWLDSTRADLLYGLRQLRLSPGFAAIAVLSLGLGIGANAAIFQLVNAIRLKTLPVQNPQDLVSIDFEKGATRPGSWYSLNAALTFAQWEQIHAQQQAFTGVLAWSSERFNLANGGEVRLAEGLYASDNFFRVLGVDALLGRTFTAQDDSGTCNAGAVLSYAFWQREFGGDPGVLERTVSLDGYPIPVIGVTPPSFFGVQVGSRYDLAVPICADRLLAKDKRSRIPMSAAWWLSIMGRLKPGWTAVSATAHLHTLSPGIMRATLPAGYVPGLAKRFLQNKLAATEAGTGISELRQQYERPLWLLMATTGLVLLIACANLANLLLARATVREREIAVRLAMGASRWRLIRQLLAESLLLAIAGAALGAALALALSHALVAFITTSDNPLFIDLAPDWRMLSFTATLGIFTCLLFGLLPAWRATYPSPASAMRSGGRSVTAGRTQFSLRRALVAIQVALSLALLFGALLFVRNLHNLLTVDAGFKPRGILTVNIDFGKAQYPEERRLAVYRDLVDRLSAIPGVVSAAQVSITPVSGATWDNLVGPGATPAATRGKQAFFSQPGPGYFRTMGTPVIAGREFNDYDTPASPKVAIVNELFARTFFGGANPVGRTFHMAADAGKPEPSFQIVGLVRNTKYRELREDFRPIAFFPIAQAENPGPAATFVLRIAGRPAQIMSAAKASVAAMSSSMGIEFRPFSAQLQDSLLRDRLMATLSGGFGFFAGLLATLGLYGVMAYMVAQRRNEIGVRVALGANRARVTRLILREAVLLLVLGLAAGTFLALWAGKAAATLLFELQPYDAISLVAASVLLTAIALVASYVPARRAAALDPMAALRME
ncbi:MAG TPA: ABC transporter permease [Bryobacteraceae bacterium]|nr:ABC transporter permease [Bryobacteraceae bacterium]